MCKELTPSDFNIVFLAVGGQSTIIFLSFLFVNRLIWEETLLDSLLNFGATPKGLLLLQQTGAINECVSYMFSRFTKKLQVIMYLTVRS